jgi:predicted RNase H-like HicB family nuclease
MREYVVIFERGAKSWGAYVPDLPGCVAAGKTKEEAAELIRGAIKMHIEGMIEDGVPVPEPRSEVGKISVAA